MRVVAYHTGGPYTQEAELLVASLEKLKIDHHVENVGAATDWDHAVSLKPIFIYRMREMYTGPLVSVDVDAFFHSDPSAYFDGLDTDFGAHWFQGPSGGYDKTRNDDWMLSGTMFWGDTKEARELLKTWSLVNAAKQAVGHWAGGGQANLRSIVESQLKMGMGWLRVTRLPGEYCYVYDKPWAYPEGTVPCIEHTIASRENRGKSKGRVHRGRQDRIAVLRKEVGL